jgi:hypothetical protein
MARNLTFLALCLLGALAVVGSLLERDKFTAPAHSWEIVDNDAMNAVVAKVDAAFAAERNAKQLAPMPRAPDLQLARRLSLGLSGTLPSLQELREFEAMPEEQRVQWWLSNLFEDRRYSDYTAERLARATVGVEEGPFLIYRRRRYVDWLSDQIQQNEPYDHIARSLINAEGIWTTRPEVNFVTVTVDQNNDKEGPDQVKLAARLTRAFMGVRIDCMQCHDDMFGDRWKQQDFHQLAAFFAEADMTISGVRDQEKSYEYEYSKRKGPEEVPPIVPFHAEFLPEDGSLRERLAVWATHPENRPFARTAVNRVWAMLFGRPLVSPIDDIPLDGNVPAAMDILADDFVANNYDVQRLTRIIVATETFQRDSRGSGETPTEAHDETYASFALTRLRPDQVAGSILQAASLKTVDAESHIITRFARFTAQSEFVKRYGDAGEDEFGALGGTIPQRLLMMNGKLVDERLGDNLFFNAATQIASVAPDDESAVEIAYLATLTRRPTAAESAHFVAQLEGTKKQQRMRAVQDMCWSLINSTEFAWNH